MNISSSHTGANAADLNRLHDLALRRAHELRQEAIDDFWHGADAVLTVGLASAQRSAQRLAQRLARHRRGRTWTIE
jgi:hypothetical protein